jgi:hypothetical protein
MEVERTFEYWRDMALRKGFQNPEVVAVGLTIAEILENIHETMRGEGPDMKLKVEVNSEGSASEPFGQS